jgi:3-deoxy-manno-octulosonate cytidylyltransferase (CMP-KDO synthetase)
VNSPILGMQAENSQHSVPVIRKAGTGKASIEPMCETEAELKVVGVIPARIGSTRLPGKVLRTLGGKAMLHHVYEAAQGCRQLQQVVVATDSQDIRAYCRKNGIRVVMTSVNHQSGTERIYEVMQSLSADVYLNLQSDEPLLQQEHVQQLIEPFRGRPNLLVTTLKTPLEPAAARNPNVVKVVTDRNGFALYFSRSPIPFHIDESSKPVFAKHLGLYGYRNGALQQYFSLPATPLERTERLEQLRFLENGIPIYVSETPVDTIGVDTEQDWEEISRRWAARDDPGSR